MALAAESGGLLVSADDGACRGSEGGEAGGLVHGGVEGVEPVDESWVEAGEVFVEGHLGVIEWYGGGPVIGSVSCSLVLDRSDAEIDVDSRGRVGERPDGNEVGARFGIRADGLQRHPA